MRNLFLLALSCFLYSLAIGQTQPEVQVFKGAEASKLIYLGKSKPLSEIQPVVMNDAVKRARAMRNKVRMIPNFTGRKTAEKVNNNALPLGVDPVRQARESLQRGSDEIEFLSIEGIQANEANAGVPDTDGAVGKNHYVQVVNASFYQVFDKEGNELSPPTAFNQLWTQFGANSGGDPIILYDQEAERWIITEFGPPFGQNQLLIAISTSDNPLGPYNAYQFITQQFPDYPKYSIWDDAYLITSNEGGTANLSFYVLDKNAMLAGSDDVSLQRLEVPGIPGVPGFFTLTPLNWSGPLRPEADTKPSLWRMSDDAWGAVPEDRLEYFTIDNIDWDSPGATQWSGPYPVIVSPFDSDPCSIFQPFSFACVPQPGPQGIDAIPQVIMNQMHYRNFGSHESIVLNFVVDATGNNVAGVRWMELRKEDERWEVYQEGTYAPDDNVNRFMGAIAIDGAGNIGLAYNVSGLTKEPSLRFTGRRASDPLGEMTLPETEFGTGTGSATTDRYGDYANMAVDPVDNRTFWFTGEYQRAGSFWGTKILAYSLQRDTNDLAVTRILSPTDRPDLGESTLVSAEVTNFGINTQEAFMIGLKVDGDLKAFESVATSIATDETYIHEFGVGVDMSNVGFYDFEIFTSLETDSNAINDTARLAIRHIPDVDVSLAAVASANGQSFVCGDTADVVINFLNNGFDTIKQLDILYRLNEGGEMTATWNGSLLFNETEAFSLEVGPLDDGENTIHITLANPNGITDELSFDNDDSLTIFTDLVATEIVFQLSLDDFPEETSWQLEDSNGNMVFSGGPYNGLVGETIEEFWCLNPDSCYILRLFDAFGDGMASNNNTGNYVILDELGRPITEMINPAFGFQETNQFCATFSCRLDATPDLSPVSFPGGSNGAVFISTTNGGDPIEFSLDGENFSSNNFFGGLQEGTYTYYVRDGYDCLFIDSFTIVACALDYTADITGVSESGLSDGMIEIIIENATGNVTYSINNGLDFQSSPVFTNLTEGTYSILIRDEAGCTIFAFNLEVGVATSVDDLLRKQEVKIRPNPSNGIYTIEVTGSLPGDYLDYFVYNSLGQSVGRGRIARYNDRYIGPLSIINESPGIYYLKFEHEELGSVYRLVKN